MWRKAYLRSVSFAAISTLPVILGCALLSATQARAIPYVVTIDQVADPSAVMGFDVVASSNTGGEFDLSGLAFLRNQSNATLMAPSQRALNLGSSPANVSIYSRPSGDATPFDGPSNFGPGGFAFPSSGSGPQTLIQINSLGVPLNYVSRSPLDISQSTYINSTFASLGITPGDYTWSWGSAPDQSFTIDAVPLPATLPLFASGLGALGLLGRRRKRRAKAIA